MPGASGLRPCTRTHLKKALCHTRPVGGTVDKYRYLTQVIDSFKIYIEKKMALDMKTEHWDNYAFSIYSFVY